MRLKSVLDSANVSNIHCLLVCCVWFFFRPASPFQRESESSHHSDPGSIPWIPRKGTSNHSMTELRINFFNTRKCKKNISESGQITIIPKPELRVFWGDSCTKPSFGVTSVEVAIICPDISHAAQHVKRVHALLVVDIFNLASGSPACII